MVLVVDDVAHQGRLLVLYPPHAVIDRIPVVLVRAQPRRAHGERDAVGGLIAKQGVRRIPRAHHPVQFGNAVAVHVHADVAFVQADVARGIGYLVVVEVHVVLITGRFFLGDRAAVGRQAVHDVDVVAHLDQVRRHHRAVVVGKAGGRRVDGRVVRIDQEFLVRDRVDARLAVRVVAVKHNVEQRHRPEIGLHLARLHGLGDLDAGAVLRHL